MGTKVKIGSPCILSYMCKQFRGTIQEIRSKSKMFLVEFTDSNGKQRSTWRHARELSPAFPNQPDAEPTTIKVIEG